MPCRSFASASSPRGHRTCPRSRIPAQKPWSRACSRGNRRIECRPQTTCWLPSIPCPPTLVATCPSAYRWRTRAVQASSRATTSTPAVLRPASPGRARLAAVAAAALLVGGLAAVALAQRHERQRRDGGAGERTGARHERADSSAGRVGKRDRVGRRHSDSVGNVVGPHDPEGEASATTGAAKRKERLGSPSTTEGLVQVVLR